ncbi:MAG: tRNA guanosine(34) transglycosylase Tgt [Chloroflexi bacterium]|nr:tRNA guanosine(34) transglycosylase Tgt [Chloroflexota bacterium]
MQPAFELLETATDSSARLGRLVTAHGEIHTPCFMPVGTNGSVRSVAPDEVRALGAQIILGNAYHLYLRPGVAVIAELGGLQRFTGWNGPILTDSGGFQVFSLAQFRKIDDEGVRFRSHLDGSLHRLTPESVLAIQAGLGSDVAMVLDECTAYPAELDQVEAALARTQRWAERSQATPSAPGQLRFGIVQGGGYPDLRQRAAADLARLDFDGYAVGGLSVGEPKDLRYELAGLVASELPTNRPRYLMGVGAPEDLVECIARGIDMFDAVLPTRIARHGTVFTTAGPVHLRNARFRLQPGPIDEGCDCYTCRHFDLAYLHHLVRAGELLALRLTTLHNLRFVVRLVDDLRAAVRDGRFAERRREFWRTYRPARGWLPAELRAAPEGSLE